jgi:quercetin dioxygenase-like cupin family protein
VRALSLGEAPGVPGAGPLDAVLLLEADLLELVHFRLQPGDGIPEHVMPIEVVFLMLEGEGILTVNGSEHPARRGAALRCPAGASRAWKNPGPDPVRVLVLKLKKSTMNGDGPMEIRRIDDQPPAENPHGVDVRRAYQSEHAMASVITLEPGQALKRHVTPVDVFFYVLEGTGRVDVGEERRTVSKDTVIESPKDIPHCWTNEGSARLRVLVVKVPNPTKGTMLL